MPKGALSTYKPAYDKAVNDIEILSTVIGYDRPNKSRQAHPFTQKGMPEIRRDKFTDGVIHSKSEFAHLAQIQESPFSKADQEAAERLDPDLHIAIDTVAANGTNIKRMRTDRLLALKRIATSLEPMRKELEKHKCATALEISTPFNIAWTAATIDGIGWPDTDMPTRYLKGFDVVFDIKDSKVFRADHQPATISKEKFMANNTRMNKTIHDEIERSAKKPEDAERRKQCWKRTREEIDEGLVHKPKSRSQMDRTHGRGKWRALGRNAILQKGKWRCIDNGKRSKHNKATTIHERITCGRADFPAMTAREFEKRRTGTRGIHKKKWTMAHGTNDLRAAYRHVPTSQPQFTCVAVWDSDKDKIVYCEVPGHNFGLTASVVNFNRFPELVTAAARRLLWITTEHYVDDFDTSEPEFAGDSGQRALTILCSLTFFGFPFDPTKTDRMHTTREYLGVITDFSRIQEGYILMDVSQKRRKSIRALVREVIDSGALRSGMAASIFGKSRFMLSPCYGSVGKACLQPIMRREYERNAHELTPAVKDSLEFIEYLTEALPAIALPLVPSDLRPVVIFSDAEGKKRTRSKAPTGHLGFVVYHPVFGKRYASAPAPKEWVTLFDKIKKRETYIGQFEMAAALAALLSIPPEWLAGRPVELWIDNSGAVGALIKGYSGVADCARIVNMFHFAAVKLGIHSIWIDYVPTESNPADIPSRLHEMSAKEAAEALSDLGEPMEMVLPAFSDFSGEWLSTRAIAESVYGPT